MITSLHEPNYLLVENPLASMLHIHSFSTNYAALLMENSTKSIYTINPAITENTECLIVKACASFINLKLGVSLDYYVSFASSCSNMLCNVPYKE